jgi:hypothetical protein
MAGYYNNAVVTLAIADAMNCHVGFLQRRHNYYSPPILGDDGAFYCLREELPGSYYLRGSSCLSKRAWTLQECVLSPRVVHFARDQVFWRCREDEWAEGYIFNSFMCSGAHFSDRAGHLIDQKECNPSWNKKLPASMQNHWGPEVSWEAWYECVSAFSRRCRTQASDKLAAIAGLASKFCEAENVKYIAGLWDRDLFHGMTWSTWRDGTSDIDLSANLFVPSSEYRAPSWSWASVDGSV